MWKFGFASVLGTSHARTGTPLQDACAAEVVTDAAGVTVLVAVASDGAGSATQAQIGSRLACELFLADVKDYFVSGGTVAQLAQEFIVRWIARFQQAVQQQAGTQAIVDYACTLLAAVISPESAVYFQLGDGAMVAATREQADAFTIVCWPQQGEYANTTNFLTDADAAAKCFFARHEHVVDEVALFTDGIQNLVLDYRNRAAHAPFFTPLFAWLRPRATGFSEELSASLAVYLNSDKINARTDDDKTLLLATRR
ncbi:MAG: PP2C family serine/threonine-protein phosphatase [Blastocatellia bacterium]